MELRIYFRHLQHYDSKRVRKRYELRKKNPRSNIDLELVNGKVPQTEWLDMTEYVSGLEKLRLTFTIDRDKEGAPALNGAYQQRKAASGSLTIEGEAYYFLKDWCEDHIAARLNEVEVKVEDTSCGEYWSWTISNKDLEGCEDGGCYYTVTLRQKEDPYHCIQNTVINDNWQQWFQKNPVNKKHPRFNYCNEMRPNGMLIVIWYLLGFLTSIAITTIAVTVIMTGNIGAVLLWVYDKLGKLGIKVPNWVKKLVPPNMHDFDRIKKELESMYIESAGCGRVHPAPLIRDYIENVCRKCNIKVDQYSCPIFFAQDILSPKGAYLEASSGVKQGKNPHYNACYLHAPSEKGIRIYSDVANDLDDVTIDTTTFYIDANAPNKPLDELLNELKTLYNAEWRIRYVNGEPTLYFWRKDWFSDVAPIYDFTEGAKDREELLQGVCFEWNEVTYPASATGLYTADAMDSSANEAQLQMGGSVSFADEDSVNKLMEGELRKTTEYFGATRFRLDGAGTDYLYDTMQQLVNSQALQMNTNPQLKYINRWIRDNVNYGLLLKDDTCMLPKVLLWDGGSFENAKCIMDKVPMLTDLNRNPNAVPKINERYNTDKKTWETLHEPKTAVKGNAISFKKPRKGIYDLVTYVGVFTSAEARLVNYPMYFEPYFEDTMWDWFHWIDDPHVTPRKGRNWSLKLDLCCENLKRLRLIKDYDLLNNPNLPDEAKETIDPAVGETVVLPLKHYPKGVITEIEVVYDGSDQYGRHISIKGTA